MLFIVTIYANSKYSYYFLTFEVLKYSYKKWMEGVDPKMICGNSALFFLQVEFENSAIDSPRFAATRRNCFSFDSGPVPRGPWRPIGTRSYYSAHYTRNSLSLQPAVFYFYFFYFRFLQKYIFVFEIYRNIPRPPGCRATGYPTLI